LEIRLKLENSDSQEINHSLSVTMRSPGHDVDLALGFLYTEAIIEKPEDIIEIVACGPVLNKASSQNIIRVTLNKNLKLDLALFTKHSFTNSSCGICGKSSLDALRTKLPSFLSGKKQDLSGPIVKPEIILKLPNLLRESQSLFEQTGGLHASALFSPLGELLCLREDVGRHNALDKVIGHALQKNELPLSQALLLVSGRVSFELVQKASMAGITIIAAVGAPSSLAIELAEERRMTLLGFIRNQQFNAYCGAWRIANNDKA
jgi:FdhD protein